MHSFELLPNSENPSITATGSSKAALVQAALQGMFAAAGAKAAPDAEPIDRDFIVKAEDQQHLLVAVLNAALASAEKHQDTYDDVRFNLITDKQAKGSFLGKPAIRFEKTIKAARPEQITINRREDGIWEAKIEFQV